MKTKKMPHLQQGGAVSRAAEFALLILEYAALDPDGFDKYAQELEARTRATRSHFPNEMS